MIVVDRCVQFVVGVGQRFWRQFRKRIKAPDKQRQYNLKMIRVRGNERERKVGGMFVVDSRKRMKSGRSARTS